MEAVLQIFGEKIELIRYIILAIALFGAVYQDIAYFKITNKWNLFVTGTGLTVALLSGWSFLLSSLSGMLIPFTIGFLLYAFKIFGAGDVKFMMALGALMGKEWIIDCMIYSILSGGILAIILMFYRGMLWERLKYLWSYIIMSCLLKKITVYQEFDSQQKQFFPFAVAIACGSLLACWL
mgnify:CR=1 FL=1